MNDDRVITLVHTNQEALNISAEYALQHERNSGATLWQWRADNADAEARMCCSLHKR